MRIIAWFSRLSVLLAGVLICGGLAWSSNDKAIDATCKKMMTFRKGMSPARAARTKKRCVSMLGTVGNRFPKRLARFSACVEKQSSMAGFRKHCAILLLGKNKKAARAKFLKYMAKAKETSGQIYVYRLREQVKTFYATHKRLPKSTGWLPATPCCKSPDQRCVKPKFSSKEIADFFAKSRARFDYFQYRFVTKGKGKTATFSLVARGDIYCNGKYVLFSTKGAIDKSGKLNTTSITRSTKP